MSLSVVIGQGTTARNGEVWVFFDVLLVCIACGLRRALGLEMSIDSYEKLVSNHSKKPELHTLIKGHKFMLLDPVQFIGVNLRRSGAFPLHSLQSLRKRL